MLISTVKKIFGTRNDRELKRMRKVVARISALEEAMRALDDNALRAKTDEFRSRLREGEKLDQLLPEAFAVVELLTAGSTLSDGADTDDGEGAGYSGSWAAFALLSRRGGERFCKPCGPRCDSGVERATPTHTK